MTKKLNVQERIRIAHYLSVLDHDAVVGVDEVAVLLNTTPARVYQASSVARLARGDISLRLPPRLLILGRRLGWRHGDIRALLGTVGAPPTTERENTRKNPTEKRLGRPRK
jgi:hypothetical protein